MLTNAIFTKWMLFQIIQNSCTTRLGICLGIIRLFHGILFGSSHRRCSIKICFKNSAKLTEKHLCRSLFLRKFQVQPFLQNTSKKSCITFPPSLTDFNLRYNDSLLFLVSECSHRPKVIKMQVVVACSVIFVIVYNYCTITLKIISQVSPSLIG